MPEEIGRIEKPAAESFAGGRKLFFVSLIYAGTDAPADYMERFERYWEQVESQINNLEGKIGRISKIYHELISIAGEGGMKFLERLNTKSYRNC